ncbi:MAG: peptidoglycan-binding protein [Patescibacteria group bacterium]|nr:peptidoglycan-binding protein [Patescibacteria group bacterium]
MNKKIMYAGVVLASMAAMTAFAAGNFNTDLSRGSRGADVTDLQNFLTDQGAYSGPATGYFGPLTEAAVKKFQSDNDIAPAAGYFGPLTRALANDRLSKAASAVAATQAPTSVADQIKSLQDMIAQLLAQVAALQSAAPATTTQPTAPATTTPEVATTTPVLPSTFTSPMTITSTYPSLTLSRYTGVTLNEYKLSSTDERVAITKLRLTNDGTLQDAFFGSVSLVDVSTGVVLASVNAPNDGVIEFDLTPDPLKPNQGLMVSGQTYDIIADLKTTNSGGERKPNIQLNINAASDVTAVDEATLSRTADITGANSFPIIGPYITMFQ